MDQTLEDASQSIQFAEFSQEGMRLSGDSGFLAGGLGDMHAYLADFPWIDGGEPDAETIDAAITRWRYGGAPIDVRDAAGASFVLTHRGLSEGRFCLISTQVFANPSDDGIARFIVENNPLPIWISDLKTGEVLVHNRPARRLFEVEDDTAPGNVADYFVDNIDNRRVFADMMGRGGFDSYVLRARSATGREFWVNGSGTVAQHNGRGILVSSIQDVTPLKQHANEVSKSRDLLSDALRALPDGFALFGDDGELVVCNDHYRDANPAISDFIKPGVHWETLLRELARRGVPRHAVGREAQWVEEMLASSEDLRAVEVECADGSIRLIATHATSLGGFIISETDITAKREAEQAARASEQLLSTILEASPANLCMSRIGDGEVIYRSPACADLFGPDRTAKDQFANPLDRADFLTDLLPSGRVDDFSASAMNAAGQRFEALFSARVIDYRGEDVMVSSATDLTEIRAAERQARTASTRLQDGIEALNEGFALFDADRKLVAWNARYAELNHRVGDKIEAGVSIDELVETAVAIGRLDRVDADRILLGADGPPDTMNFEFQNKDGDWFYISRNPTSEGGFVITRLDITERKRTEEAVAHQREMLHQSEKLSAMGELLAGVAHELNNPLSVVVGHALMLEEEVAEPALQKRTGKISSAAERCSRIVKTFLAMARQRPVSLELVSVDEIIDTALDVAAYGLRSSGAKIIRRQAKEPPPVNADPDQLAQVFTNLIVNAEHVLADQGADGVLEIETRSTKDGSVEIIFDDNGPGVPDAIRARIFEPFFTTKTVGQGTGIGLAFCHRIIQSHDGEIIIEDAPGGGARFRITLGAATDERRNREEGETRLEGRRRKVLIVDDEPDVMELIADILRRDGFEAHPHSSASDALAELPGDFDLILSDLNMPDIDGQALFEEMRRRWPELEQKVGFITGDTMSAGAQAFLNEAGRPCIEKPVTPNELRRLVSDVLNLSETATDDK